MVRFFRRYGLGGIFHQSGRNSMLDRLCAMWAMNFAHDSSGGNSGSSGGNTYEKYSWEGVFASIDAGTYATDYAIGDMIPLDLGSEGLINMQIVAFDADDLADGSGKAPITWVSECLLKTSHRMNPTRVANGDGTYQEGTGGIGGWEKSEMRTYLTETIKPLIPEEVRNAIVPVTKYSRNYNTAGSSVNNVATTDDVWIPSYREIFGGTSYETQGVIYSEKFTDATSRIKQKVGGSAAYWWLRSANSASDFRRVSSSGGNSNISANNSSGVAFGFCT